MDQIITKPFYTSFEIFFDFYFFTNGYESIFIPSFVTSKSIFKSWVRRLSNMFAPLTELSYRVLHVKGIGFKVYSYFIGHSLYFLLGYNHVCKYRLPNSIFAKVRKNYLLMYSVFDTTIGASIHQIQHLRYPDPYRGKGIRFRFQIIKFKPGKQR